MTLPLGRKDTYGVAFVLISLVRGNINKTPFQAFIIRIPRNSEHKRVFLETQRLQISQRKVDEDIHRIKLLEFI